MRIILILISLCFSCLSFAYDEHFEPNYPFQPFVREIPPPALERIHNNDILFVGETHIASTFLRERQQNSKSMNKIGRQNSLNQENLYFNLVKKFSEIHALAKKCLWLEYDDDDDVPNLEKKLNGLSSGVSHYYLINEAKAQGWSVFAVDGNGDGGGRDDYMSKNIAKTIQSRDDYMAKNIAKTIQNGQCEKGISVNGSMHLSCTVAYPSNYCRDPNNTGRFASLDTRLRTELKNMGLAKSIEILRIYSRILTSVQPPSPFPQRILRDKAP